MHTETRTYTDYAGNERTETFSFNLTKAEVLEMEMKCSGGMEQYIKRIIDAQDTAQIIEVFKELLLKSYGVISPDGRRFEKSPELTKEFAETEAYSDMFMELATDDVKAAKFVEEILPKMNEDQKKQANEMIAQYKERNATANPIPPTVQ